MFQGLFIGVLMDGCLEGVVKVFQGIFKGSTSFSRNFQECFKEVLRMFQGTFWSMIELSAVSVFMKKTGAISGKYQSLGVNVRNSSNLRAYGGRVLGLIPFRVCVGPSNEHVA